jgi:hypothetical protein
MNYKHCFFVLALILTNTVSAAPPDNSHPGASPGPDTGVPDQLPLDFDCLKGEVPTSQSGEVFCGLVPLPGLTQSDYTAEIENRISNVWVIPTYHTRRSALSFGDLLNLNTTTIEVKAVFVGADATPTAARYYEIPAGGTETFVEPVTFIPGMATRSLGDVRWVVLASMKPFIVTGHTIRIDSLKVTSSYEVPAVPVNCNTPVGFQFACNLITE